MNRSVALDDNGRPLFRARPVVVGDAHEDDISAPTHALSLDASFSPSFSTALTSGYISRTSAISSSSSRIVRTRSNISLGIRTNVSEVLGLWTSRKGKGDADSLNQNCLRPLSAPLDPALSPEDVAWLEQRLPK
jgi:hypothetical protein